MITKVFSLYDSKAQAFGPPFYMQTRGMAVRALADTVQDNNSMVSRHPEDYVLYQIAEFDDNTAEYKNKNPHELVSMASDFKKQNPTVINEVISSKNGDKEKVVA